MVELKTIKQVSQKDENEPMFVEIPVNIVEGLGLYDKDKVEWSYSINCKNQRVVTMKRKYE